MIAVSRHERQWDAASEFINGKISGEEFQQSVRELIAARSGKASINGASNVMKQPAKTRLHAFPVNPTEASNVPGRRLSRCFREGEANGAAPVSIICILCKQAAQQLDCSKLRSRTSNPIIFP
jgi:hypothetical protein